jgi:hypothetical protein
MAKPTPGPYELVPNGGCTEPDENYWGISARTSGSGFFISGFMSEDDARLLAASWELLEECKALSGAIARAADFAEGTRVGDALGQAEAAIAKAEGAEG